MNQNLVSHVSFFIQHIQNTMANAKFVG